MPQENEDQYIWRIGQMKNTDLVNDTWEDLADIINAELRGDDPWYDASVYRKRFRDFSRAWDNIFCHMIKDNPEEQDRYIEELKELKRAIEKEKKKVQTEKIELNRWHREEARDELIVEKIEDAIAELEPLTYPTAHKEPALHNTGKSWVLAFGDAHFGAELLIKGLCGEEINKYNPEIFYERMDKLMCDTIEIILKENIDELYVFDLGDQIDGILRVSQLLKLRYGVVDSTIKYAEWLANWLNELSKCCRIKFRSCHGNHCEIRHLGQKKGAFEEENMGKIIHEFVRIRLKDNPNVDILGNDNGIISETIQGNHIMAFHGESKNLEATMKDFEKIYGFTIDILIAGHLHHAYSETVAYCCDVMRIPSIIGIDDYSLKLHKTSNPGATMFCVEPELGKTIEYHIKL